MQTDSSLEERLVLRTHDFRLGYFYEARGHSLYVFRKRTECPDNPIFTSPVNIYSAFHSADGRYLIINHGSGSWGAVAIVFDGSLKVSEPIISEEKYREIIGTELKRLYPKYSMGTVLHLYAPIREMIGQKAILRASGDFYLPKSEGGFGQIPFEGRFFEIDLVRKSIRPLRDEEGPRSWYKGMTDYDAAYGSGFFVTNRHIITNAHVVGDATRVSVELGNRGAYAKVVCVSKIFDLATLEIAKNSLDAVPIKLASDIQFGGRVRVFGHPLPFHQGYSLKVTDGIISGMFGLQDDPLRFQISAPIQPGNSGGAIVNESDELVGVAVSALDKLAVAKQVGHIPENVSLGIHVDVLRVFLEAQNIDLGSSQEQFQPEMACVQVVKTRGWGAR